MTLEKVPDNQIKPTVYAAAKQTTPQTGIATGTPTTITFDNEEKDSHNFFNPATGIFAPTIPGTYQVQGAATLASVNAGSIIIIGVYRNNGTTDNYKILYIGSTGATGNAGGSGGANFYLDGVNDTLRLWVYHTHGSNRSTIDPGGTDPYTWIQIQKISDTDITGW